MSRIVNCVVLLCFLFLTGCSGGGGTTPVGAYSDGGSGNGAPPPTNPQPPSPQTVNLTLKHSFIPRAVPGDITGLRLTGFDGQGAAVFGPQLFVYQSELTVTVPITLVKLDIEYIDSRGVFGRFSWFPNVTSGSAELSNPAWDTVQPVSPTQPASPMASITSVPKRTMSERVWGADRYLVFSTTTRLTGDDIDSQEDIYLRDLLLGDLKRVTIRANGPSRQASVSQNGRWIVFQSDATNLDGQDSNGFADVVLWDKRTGKFTNITRNANGESGEPAISADGSVIAFSTSATNLVPQDTDSEKDVLVYERASGTLSLASANIPGDAVCPSLNNDGSRIAFCGKYFGLWQVLLLDRTIGSRLVVSQSPQGVAGNGDSFHPSLSHGEHLVFSSQANNLTTDDSDAVRDIFRFQNDAITRVQSDASQPVLSRTSDNFVSIKSGGVSLVANSVSSLGQGTGAALSGQYVALVDESIKAINPVRGELIEMEPQFVALGEITGPKLQDFNISDPSVVFDFNEDGYLDTIHRARNVGASRSLKIISGSSNGTFTAQDFDLAALATDLAHGLFNSDQHEDFIAITSECSDHSAPPQLRFFAGDGNGGFTEGPTFNAPEGGLLEAGQLNGSGGIDLLVFEQESPLTPPQARSGQVLFGNGDGTFVDSGFRVPLPTKGSTPVLGHFNSDTFSDVAVINSNTLNLEVYLNNGDGSFSAAITRDLSQQHPAPHFTSEPSLTVVDWDGSGPDDLVVGSYSKVEVLTATNGGGFTSAFITNRTGRPFVGNLDEVPGTDLFQSGSVGALYSGGQSTPTLSLSTDNGVLFFQDLNNDSIPDLVGQTNTGIVVIPSIGNGVFGRPVQAISSGLAASIGDFDGDLRAELVTESHLYSYVEEGKFKEVATLPSPGLSSSAQSMVEDLNNDGHLDIVYNNMSGYHVFLGDGAGAFNALNAVEGLTLSDSIRLVDLNEDGTLDLISSSSSEADFHRGQGDGTFAEPVPLITGNNFFNLVQPQDFDGDGLLDLAVTSHESIELFSGLGNETFSAPTSSAAYLPTHGLTVDLTNDGIPEIVPFTRAFAFFSDGGCGTFPPQRLSLPLSSFLLNLANGSFTNTELLGNVSPYRRLYNALPVYFSADGTQDLLGMELDGNHISAQGDGTSLTVTSSVYLGGESGRYFYHDFGFDGKPEVIRVYGGLLLVK